MTGQDWATHPELQGKAQLWLTTCVLRTRKCYFQMEAEVFLPESETDCAGEIAIIQKYYLFYSLTLLAVISSYRDRLGLVHDLGTDGAHVYQ